MKHYEEMAQTVLERIEIKKRQKRRRAPLVVGAVLACCLVVFGGLKAVFVLPGPYMGPTMDTSYCWPEPRLEDFYREPDYIVQGTVTAVKEDYFLNPLDLRNRPNAKVTVYEMALKQTYKGALSGDTVLIKVVNGEGFYTAWYEDAVKAGDIEDYRLEVGTEYILGLETIDSEGTGYEAGDFYIYYRRAMTFTQNEEGKWQSSWGELILETETLKDTLLKDVQTNVQQAELVVQGTVAGLNREYYTFHQEDHTQESTFVREYAVTPQKVLKGNCPEDRILLRAYDLHGSITMHEYYKKEIEEGMYELFAVEEGAEYILLLKKNTSKDVAYYGDTPEGYQLVADNGGYAACDYLYRACFIKGADGAFRNVANPKWIIDPKTLQVRVERKIRTPF